MASFPARPNRRGRRGAALIAVLLAAGCTVGGTPVRAPYRDRPLDRVSAAAVPALADAAGAVLALSPDGSTVAVADPVHGACLRSRSASTAGPLCARVSLSGRHQLAAAFSPDGRRLAVGSDVTARTRGRVWVMDVRTGVTVAVPPPDGPVVAPSSAPSAGAGAGVPARGVPADVAMLWAAGGDLLLMSSSYDADGARNRLVDVDPQSLIPRVVAQATGPYEFFSGFAATGGNAFAFTVYRGDQLPPNLVVINLDTGVRHEFAPLGPAGTQLTPLAVSPDGRHALVGFATLQDPGPPQLIDLASGALTGLPGLSGDFRLAAFSPDGRQLASVAGDGSVSRLSLAATPGGGAAAGPARSVAQLPDSFSDGSSLGWSIFDVLSVTGPGARSAGSVLGWSLTG